MTANGVRLLLYKHDDLSLHPQNPYISWKWRHMSITELWGWKGQAGP